MTDKENFRAEIERRYNEYMAKDSELAAIRADECLGILSYIDSMQEEPTAKEYLCIKDFYPYEKGKVYKSIDGGFPANAKEYFKLVEEPSTSVWHDTSEKPKMNSIIVMNNSQTTLSVEYVGQSLCGVERWAYLDILLKL